VRVFHVNGRSANEDWRLPERAAFSVGEVAWGRFGTGSPVVLVHGTPSWSYMWRRVVPLLETGFCVYLLDLVGYGDSSRNADEDMSVSAQSRALAELLDLWEVESPALVGHDIGGSVVLRAHLVEGRPASRIALVDAAVLLPWNTPATLHMKEHLDAYRTMPAHIYERIVSAHLATAMRRSPAPDELDAYIRPWRGAEGQAAYFRKIEQWRDDDMAVLEPLLETVNVPVLVLWGEEDVWLTPETGERLAAAIPGAKFEGVRGAGHFAMEDAPEEVAARLAHFLSG
jgi:pimeloyl-ACP methyl ester carboxylesterase